MMSGASDEEREILRGPVDLPRDGSHEARTEWHAKNIRIEAAYRELCAMSTNDPPACVGESTHVGGSTVLIAQSSR